MSIQLIDKVSNTSDLLGKEGQWAYRLQTIRPLGLNENDFFYSQKIVARVGFGSHFLQFIISRTNTCSHYFAHM